MSDVLERYINAAYEYKFTQGPDVVKDNADALKYGINCVALAHLAIRDLFDYELPRELQCAEMYLDKQHFTKVEDIDTIQRGDLVWFGIDDAKIEPQQFEPVYKNGTLINWADFPIKHVTVHTGNKDSNRSPMLLHATHIGGTNTVWPLNKFAEYRKYRKMFGITRLMPRLRQING